MVRDYLDAHARMYQAIKAADTIDADGDGVAGVGRPQPVGGRVGGRRRANQLVDRSRRRRRARPHRLRLSPPVRPTRSSTGTFDTDLDGTPDEQHPEWQGKLDWLGVQYYSRIGVTGTSRLSSPPSTPRRASPPLDFGACVPPIDPTFCVPRWATSSIRPGFYNVLADFGDALADRCRSS